MASSEVSIDKLPVVAEIVNGDFLIVQSPNATTRLDFKNFVVGLDNTTFKSTIDNSSTGVTTLSNTLYNGVTAYFTEGSQSSANKNLVGVSRLGALTGAYGIPINIKDTTGAVHTFQILLSATSGTLA